MKARPEFRDIDRIVAVIDDPDDGFVQDRYLVLVTDMLPTLTRSQRTRLKDVVDSR